MTERGIISVIITSAIALLMMGLLSQQTTGTTVVGERPEPALTRTVMAVDVSDSMPPFDGRSLTDDDVAAMQWTVDGAQQSSVMLVPDSNPESWRLAAQLLARERAFGTPRPWTLRIDPVLLDKAPKDYDSAIYRRLRAWGENPRPRSVLMIHAEVEGPMPTIGVVAEGRAAPPWLRRVFSVAEQVNGVELAPSSGWAELRARAAVDPTPGLGAWLRSGIPAIALTVPTTTPDTGVSLLTSVIDQLQTESRLPGIGADQFALTPAMFLTATATRWLWVWPLLPLTFATGGRYAIMALRPEFQKHVRRVGPAMMWWSLPCVGGAAMFVFLPGGATDALPLGQAIVWIVVVASLIAVARWRERRRASDDVEAHLMGGAMVLDLLWSTYAMGALVRPWATGAWLAAAAFAWPWVYPAKGRNARIGVALLWIVGVVPSIFWLARVPGEGVLGLMGWLASDITPPWGMLLAGFATAVGLRLIWWAVTAPPLIEIIPEPEPEDDGFEF